MRTTRMPLLERLLEYGERGQASFHVPGHKSGKGLPPGAGIFRQLLSIDLTEITGLDDLHHPEGVIREAQQLAAACFGAEETCFLVNGSTVGNLAAILSLCASDDVIIVQRNAHKSVLHGLMLAGAKAVFVTPRYDTKSGLAAGVGAEVLETALARHPEAKGVLLTNPNYYGMGGDLRRLARLTHRYGKPLVVDEAHGAHYGFHTDLPESALAAGADLVVQSTHKMLSAMTMGAMLHMQGDRIDRGQVKQRLAMLQSSSPSYPIMASLDASRVLLQAEGKVWLDRGLRAVSRFERALGRSPWFQTIAGAPSQAYETKDPFKVAVCDATGTLSGFGLRDELERRGIMTEMADPRHVLLVFSLASDEHDADKLVQAMEQIADAFALPKKNIGAAFSYGDGGLPDRGSISEPVSFRLNPRTATASIALSDAVGQRAGEMVIPYPPGIPVLYEGEIITEEVIRYIRHLAAEGARFQGISDPGLQTMRICI